jgi:hypothetical protein
MAIRITRLRLAAAGLFVLAGVGIGSLLSPLIDTALATVGQTVNISDHSSSAFFAKVSSDGKLAVGDGAGPLSVDGTVSARPVAPSSPLRSVGSIGGSGAFIAGPSASPINITSLSISTNAATGSGIVLTLVGEHVPNSATTCAGAVADATLWQIVDLGDGTTPVEFTFPTPLQFKAPANTKACVFAQTNTNEFTSMNAVGFYGG